ncbi:MAG: plastocyanin/azurin family copper-binding protein [Candidatus Binatia bacterium]
MRHSRFWLPILFWLFLPAGVLGAGGSGKTGVVKGTITIGGRPAPGVVVSIEGLPRENLKSRISNTKSKRPMMDQRDMKFIPHVMAVSVGTTVDFPNNDKTFHNVFSNSEPKKFDLGLYPAGESRSVTFDEPGVVRILCNVHPHMEAHVVVKEHPYFIVSDRRGNYHLDAVALGKYHLEVWHPELGKKVEPFNLVREGEVLVIDVDLSPAARGVPPSLTPFPG